MRTVKSDRVIVARSDLQSLQLLTVSGTATRPIRCLGVGKAQDEVALDEREMKSKWPLERLDPGPMFNHGPERTSRPERSMVPSWRSQQEVTASGTPD